MIIDLLILLSEYKTTSFVLLCIVLMLSLLFILPYMAKKSYVLFLLFPIIYVSVFFVWFYSANYYSVVESKVCFAINTNDLQYDNDKFKNASIETILKKNNNNLNNIKNITFELAKEIAPNYNFSENQYKIQEQKYTEIFKQSYIELITSMNEVEHRLTKSPVLGDGTIEKLEKIKRSFDFRVCDLKYNFNWNFTHLFFEDL